MDKKWHRFNRLAKFGNLPFIALALLALIALMGNAWADEEKAHDPGALAKASQNPVSSLISLPFQNDATFNNGPEDAFVNVLTIKPVIPMSVTENWNLINRAIIPAVYQSEAHQGQTTTFIKPTWFKH